MKVLKLLYRDVDRTPYLYTLKHAAEKYGLELQMERATGPQYGEHLESGKADVLAENYWGLQSFAARGVPFFSVASSVTWMNETLLVHPSISIVDDLRGKKFAIRKIGPSEILPGLWLKDMRLHGDVEQVFVSESEVGRWGNWKKVLQGECHGCFVTNLYADEALEAGLKAMPYERYGILGNVTLTVSGRMIDENRENVQNLVNATFDATRIFKNDRSTTLEIMGKEPRKLLKVDNDKKLERFYEILREELSEVPLPSAEGIANTLRMRLDRSPELASFNPLLMWDLSFAREALKNPPVRS
ncbi:MAG TPA: ABC transporter substrate-binding protein [Candidatus Binatia bacterium]